MKNKKLIFKIFIVIVILISIFFCYKLFILNKYNSEERLMDINNIFNEVLTINKLENEESNEVLKFEGLSIKNYFEEYEETENDFKVKYNDKGEIIAFYSISQSSQYVEILSFDSLSLYSDTETNPELKQDKYIKDFFEKQEINNDIDFLKFIKENYYIKNNIFMTTKMIKNNYLINTFVEVSLPEFKDITLIDGKINGYIINMKNIDLREIHILNNNIQYIITLSGEELTSNDFIKDLLQTIKLDKQ